MPISPYRIDPDGLVEAAQYLGLRAACSVVIRLTAASGRYVRFDELQLVHRMVVNPYMCRQDAEWAIWHEMTHARQVERFGNYKTFEKEWMRQFKERGLKLGMAFNTPGVYEAYCSMPLEAEANETANARPSEIQVTAWR